MAKISRRSVLKGVSAGAIAAIGLPKDAWAGIGQYRDDSPPEHPRLREVILPGFHAYASEQSVAAGDALRFHVSSSVPYQLEIIRLGSSIDDDSKDEVIHRFEKSPAKVQAITPGSFIHVEKGLTTDNVRQGFAIECWLRLFRDDAPQGLLTQSGEKESFGLSLSSAGELQFCCGETLRGVKPQKLKWTHVVAQWDGKSLTLWVDGQLAAKSDFAGPVKMPIGCLLLGAAEVDGRVDQFLDGDLAMPVIYDRALDAAAIQRRFSEKGQQEATGNQVLACWSLQEEQGDFVHDDSPHQRHGRIINHATWMIGGPSFDGKQVPRYGVDYQPSKDKTRGHGLRFASDDLYDCGWEATHEFTVPVSAKSGVYCACATFEVEGKPKVSYVTFIVKKNRNRAKAPILVLCSSNTWLAYNSTPFSVNLAKGEKWNASTAGGVNSHPLAPTYSYYLDHRFGQPSYQFGMRMPWPIAGPNVWYSAPEVGYSHLMRGERFTHVWLDENNYDYDVIADVDLHREPDLLDGYSTVLINGHSEYWSIDAYQGMDKYLRNGGTAIVFSGNTMFWRVSFNQDCSIMECRKLDDRIGGRAHANIGELFHSQDGKRGSLMRECGWPAWKVVGLECDGWGGVGPDDFGVYITELPDHFLFREPERVELAKAATFGHAPGGGFPKAIGHEWDVRVPRLNSMTRTIPAQASLPEEPAGIVTLARGVRKQTEALDYFTQATSAPDGTVAEMIYWERPEGGRVFHGGAIGVGWALSADPKLQTLIRNVLHHFGVKPG